MIGLFKRIVQDRGEPPALVRSREEVEWETLGWVDWYNNRRLLGSVGNVPPAEAEAAYYAGNMGHAMAARLDENSLWRSPGDSVRGRIPATTTRINPPSGPRLIGCPNRSKRLRPLLFRESPPPTALRIAMVTRHPFKLKLEKDASITYRCENLAAGLRRLGHHTWLGPVLAFPWQEHWDVIVFHRPQWTWPLRLALAALQRRGVHAIADFDDLVFDPALAAYSPRVVNSREEINAVAHHFESSRRALVAFRQITVSTEPLAMHARRMFGSATVSVIPNAVHWTWLDMDPPPARATASDMLLCYLPGSRSHDLDFALIAKVLEKVLRRHPRARLRVTGPLNYELNARPGQVEHHPRVPFSHFHAQFRDPHVNLAPLEQTPFNECKSAIKVMEAAWWNIPTVCTPIPDVLRFTGAGACLAVDADAFEATIEKLLSDEAKYLAARNGLRQRVQPLADIHDVAQQWLAHVQPFLRI